MEVKGLEEKSLKMVHICAVFVFVLLFVVPLFSQILS